MAAAISRPLFCGVGKRVSAESWVRRLGRVGILFPAGETDAEAASPSPLLLGGVAWRGRRTHRTTDVVNSRVKRLWNGLSLRIGTMFSSTTSKGLRLTTSRNRPIVILLRPPATSANVLAPSRLKSERHRMSAFSLNRMWDQGKNENRWPPRGWSHVGPKLTKTLPDVFSKRVITSKILDGSAKCSKESIEMITSAFRSVSVTKKQFERRARFAFSLATSSTSDRMSMPMTRSAPALAISIACSPNPQPKSITDIPCMLPRNSFPRKSLTLLGRFPRSIHSGASGIRGKRNLRIKY